MHPDYINYNNQKLKKKKSNNSFFTNFMTDEWLRDTENIFLLVKVNVCMSAGAERVLKPSNVVYIYFKEIL